MNERVCNYSELFMRANGDVYPCCRLWTRDEYRIGHVTDPAIADKVLAFYKPCSCEAFVFRRARAADKPAFARFNVETSMFCQAKCAMCCVGAPDYVGAQDSPFLSELERLIGQLRPAALTVQGGEVLVQKKTMAWLKGLKQRFPAMTLDAITNMSVPLSQIDELESIFTRFDVSMVGFQPETYHAVMGLSVDRTQQMVRELIQRNKMGVMVKFLLVPLNIHEVGAWLEWALDSGARSLQIAYASGWEWVVPNTTYRFWEKIFERASARLKRVLVSRFSRNTGFELVFEEKAARLLDVTAEFVEKHGLKGVAGVGGALPKKAPPAIATSFPETTRNGKMVRPEFKEVWSFVTARSGRVYVYGAGAVSMTLLDFLKRHDLPLPAALLDDAPAADERRGVRVTGLNAVALRPDDTVVLGSDTFQAAMRKQLAARDFKGGILEAAPFIEGS